MEKNDYSTITGNDGRIHEVPIMHLIGVFRDEFTNYTPHTDGKLLFEDLRFFLKLSEFLKYWNGILKDVPAMKGEEQQETLQDLDGQLLNLETNYQLLLGYFQVDKTAEEVAFGSGWILTNESK